MKNVFGLKRITVIIKEKDDNNKVIKESILRSNNLKDDDDLSLIDTAKVSCFNVEYAEDNDMHRTLYPIDVPRDYSYIVQKLNESGKIIKSIYFNSDNNVIRIIGLDEPDVNKTEVYNMDNKLIKNITPGRDYKIIDMIKYNKYILSIVQKNIENHIIDIDMNITFKDKDNDNYINFHDNVTKVSINKYNEETKQSITYELRFNTVKFIKSFMDKYLIKEDSGLSDAIRLIKVINDRNNQFDLCDIDPFIENKICTGVYHINESSYNTIKIEKTKNYKFSLAYGNNDIHINDCRLELNMSGQFIFIGVFGAIIYDQPNKKIYKINTRCLKLEINKICENLIEDIIKL